jgi:hypothetical protein
MLAPAIISQRVRCRQIAESDLSELTDLLARGFPRSTRVYWSKGFERLKKLPQIEPMPRFGYVLETERGLVGALLTITSRRPDGRIVANVSSWYVEPNWRSHSTVLVSAATKHKHVTYINTSPAPHTWRTLTAQGYYPYNFGRSAVFALLGLGGGRVHTEIPQGLPEHTMLLDHRSWGCVSLVCEKDGELFPFIFKPRRLDQPPVRVMDLLYCRSTADFARCGAALGRHALLRHGAVAFLIDGKISGLVSHYVEGKEPRYYKGEGPPPLNDLAYTESTILG